MKTMGKWTTGIFILVSILGARADVFNTWTTNQVSTNISAMDYIAYGNGCYVATGDWWDSGAVYTSMDGFHWVTNPNPNFIWGTTISYANGVFVGVSGGYGTVILSTNGTNWTVNFQAIPSNVGGYGHGDITYGHNLYVLVSDTNNVGCFMTSPDGLNWTFRGATTPVGGHISSVVYGKAFVAVGNNDGYTYISTLGTSSWTRRSIPGGSQISYGNNLYVVPLNAGTNLVSADGISWSSQPTGLTNMCARPVYANGIFLARAGSYAVTSSDGTNWLQMPTPIPGNSDPTEMSMATDGSHLVTIGTTYLSSGAGSENPEYAYTSDLLVGIVPTNSPAHSVTLSGLLNRNYQIQSASGLTAGGSGWQTNATLTLTNTPYVWTDHSATNLVMFYRGVLMQ